MSSKKLRNYVNTYDRIIDCWINNNKKFVDLLIYLFIKNIITPNDLMIAIIKNNRFDIVEFLISINSEEVYNWNYIITEVNK